MLDKNPEQDFELKIKPILEKNNLNSVLCDEPFLKASFLEKIIEKSDVPIHYLDFDLLYSGFISGEILSKKENLHLYRPISNEFQNTLKTVLEKISEEKSIVIIDSLNGLYSLYPDNKDAGRLINSYVMLFCSIAKNSNSQVLVSGMTRRKNNEEWVLSITGRHIFEIKQMNSIWLEQENSSFIANILDEKANPKKSYTIQISSELI